MIALSFVVLVLTGSMLFVSPPGRIANWTHWTLGGLTKREWTGLHVWFSTTFLVVSIVHILFNWRPFSWLLSFNAQAKESWETAQERAPIRHADLLTIAELAQKAGVDVATATNRLTAQGIQGVTPDGVVQPLAEANRKSARQVYEAMLTSPGPGGDGLDNPFWGAWRVSAEPFRHALDRGPARVRARSPG